MKTHYKFILAISGIVLVVLLVSIGIWKGGWFSKQVEPPQQDSSQITGPNQQSSLMAASFETEKFLTNDGANFITRGFVHITKEELAALTEQQFVEFVVERVENSGFHWVTIFSDDGTGIVFTNSNIQYPVYGMLDEIGRITQPIAEIYTLDAEQPSLAAPETNSTAVPNTQETAVSY